MTACPLVAGTLNLYIGVSQFHLYFVLRLLNSTTIYSTYLHLKVKTIIEFFIVKREQSFVLEVGASIRLALNWLYITIRIRGRSPRT